MLPENRFQSTAAYHPPATAIAPLVSAREWPVLTLYRDGLGNLNALATEVLRTATAVRLIPPPPTKPGRLAKAWQLHADPTGAPLIPHGMRVGTRFRDSEAADALFAAQPADIERLVFALTPEPGHPDRFRLLPL